MRMVRGECVNQNYQCLIMFINIEYILLNKYISSKEKCISM